MDNETGRRLINKCSIKEDGSYYSRSYVDKFRQTFRMVMAYAVKNGYCQCEQTKQHGMMRKAVTETIRICKDNKNFMLVVA